MQLNMTASIRVSFIRHLEFKKIKGLFSGGQFNGSSGYEEAAAQGLIAGINAAMEIKGQEAACIGPFRGLYRRTDR